MPELPEVECLTRAVRSVLEGKIITEAKFHRENLRWPIPIAEFQKRLVGKTVRRVHRRSKYMLVETDSDVGIFHLGMTGNLLRSGESASPWKHTHASFRIEDDEDFYLHFVDPRRFGAILTSSRDDLATHELFRKLGPEPLEISAEFLAEHLFKKSRSKIVPIKSFLMDAHVVVGVGNIYANESLFRAGVRPTRQAQKVKKSEWQKLAEDIQAVLKAAIEAGGTSFRDYKHTDGQPGYFELALQVYGRDSDPCRICSDRIKHKKLGGRATYYCPTCQS